MREGRAPAAAAAVSASIQATVWVLRTAIVPEPYMDEVFHVPQARRFCDGDFAHWDPKITTFPGLYLASAVPSWVAATLGLTPSRGWPDLCSTAALRLINGVGLGALCAWAHVALYVELHGTSRRRSRKG